MTNRKLLALGCILASAVVALADSWSGIYRGLSYLATPLGNVSSGGDGFQVNGNRSGRLRIVPSGIGGGYELQFDRTFGTDASGRPETLHFLGIGDLTLNGSTQATLGYSGKQFRTYRANFRTSNLTYDLRSTVGAQDAQLTGTLNVANTLEINSLGFYTLSVTTSNTNSELKLDGVAVRDEQPLNYDIGPINIKGNIFVDGLGALAGALGMDTSDLQKLFPASPISQFNAALAADLQNVKGSAGETRNLAPLLSQAVLNGDGQAAQTLLQGVVDGTVAGNGLTPDAAEVSQSALLVPEPGTLVLLTVGGISVWSRRRR